VQPATLLDEPVGLDEECTSVYPIATSKTDQMIQNLLPRNLTWLAIHLVGVDCSHLANALATGDTLYLSFVLRKI